MHRKCMALQAPNKIQKSIKKHNIQQDKIGCGKIT